jgi:hypothetical protein
MNDFRTRLKEAVDRQTLVCKVTREVLDNQTALYTNLIDAASTTENVPSDLITNEIDKIINDWELLLDAAYRYLDLLD